MAKNLSFEKSIKALETIVNALESGELSLDDALKQYEKGLELSRQCQSILTEAEQKVKILTNHDENQEQNSNEWAT